MLRFCYRDLRLNEQSTVSSSPFKLAFVDQIKQMGAMANIARGLAHFLTSSGESVISKNNRVMHDVLMPKVYDRLASGAQAGGKQTILDLALKQFDVENTGGKGAKPDAEFLDALLSNLKVFVFAGHDTTATTICWMFKVLQDNPAILAKMRAEHTAVLGPDSKNVHEVVLASPHLLYALPYTLAVIKETLRLYPLAATIRDGSAEFFLTVPGSSVQYPTEGFAMWDGVLSIQTRPDLWPQAKECIPERWLVAADDPLYPTKDSWRAFSTGSRSCIGQELALAELRLVAVLVARRFDIELNWSEWDLQQ
jgi:cytochrome P450